MKQALLFISRRLSKPLFILTLLLFFLSSHSLPAIADGSISGKVTIQNRTDHSAPITFKLKIPGQTAPIQASEATTASDGSYQLNNIPAGIYNLSAKALNSLSQNYVLIEVTEGQNTSNIDFSLLGGDANNDNSVALSDRFILRKAWNTNIGDVNWDERADFNGDNSIGLSDKFILSANWYKNGSEPQISIDLPEDNSISAVSPISVSGTTDNDVSTVTVNGLSATIDSGTFYADNVPLSSGLNVISAIAVNAMGNKNADLIRLSYDPNFTPTEVFEDFDGNNPRVDYWWNGYDGENVYTRSLDHTLFRGGSTSMKVEYNKSGYPLSLFAVQLKCNGIDNDFSKYDKLSFWVYTDNPQLTIRVKFEDGDGHSWEGDCSSSVQGEWQRFVYDFSGAHGYMDLSNISWNLLFFADPGQANTQGIFYMDDIALHSSKPYFHPPLTTPTLSGPTEPVYGEYQLNWTDIPGAGIYELQEIKSHDFSSTYVYWTNDTYRNFNNRVIPTAYYYRLRAWSNVPEEGGTSSGWSNIISLKIIDGPPIISEVYSLYPIESHGTYVHSVGDYVKICLKEKYNAPDITSGTFRIISASQSYDSGLVEATKSEDGLYYFYHWDTNGLNPADDYIVAAILTDAIGQTDTDGSDEDPDLTISLILAAPSRYGVNLEADFSISSIGIPLKFERFYHSDMLYDGPMGDRWTHSYNMQVEEQEDGNVALLWKIEDYWNFFIKNPDGTYKSPLGGQMELIKNPDSTFTLKRNNINYNFNPDNKLANIEDLNGNQVTLTYFEGLLYTITDTSGRQITFGYYTGYTNPKIKSITDFAGRTFNYEYDSSGNLVKYINPAGYETTYNYDGHNLTIITNPRGYHTYFSYIDDKLYSKSNDDGINHTTYTFLTEPNRTIITNARGYETTYIMEDTTHSSTVDALGNITTTISSDQGYPLSVTDANENTWFYAWDENGNRTTVTCPYENTTTYVYNQLNLIASRTDAKGNATSYTYGERGNLVEERDAYDNVATMSYDQYGQIAQMVDKNGNITKFEYNDIGSVVKITKKMKDAPDPDVDLIVTMEYDSIGNRASFTDPEGNTTTFDYDILNRLICTTDPIGNKTGYTYDENNNITQITYKDSNDAVLKTTSKTYDVADRLKTVTDHLGNTTIYDYDVNGNTIKITDALGNANTFTYDERDLLSSKTDANGSLTTYSYNVVKKLTSIEDANNNITSYNYNDVNKPITITYPDFSQETYTYNEVGNLLSKTNRAGEQIAYAYDSLNRLITQTYPDLSTVQYVYDNNSRLITATDSNGTTTYSYDKADRLVSVVDIYGKVVSYEYSKAGGRTKMTYPDNEYITYARDELNRLTSIKDISDNNIAAYDYNALLRVTNLTLENGTETAYEYDNIGRLLDLVNKKTTTAPETILSSFGYTYDNIGNRLTKTTMNGTYDYTYNNIYELTQVEDPENNITVYNYNGVHSRTNVNGESYIINNLNQYTNVGSTNYIYDTKGNLTGDESWSYTYDYENRLISAADGITTATYTYDYSGRRIAKDVDGVTTRYVYDGIHIIAEYDASDSLLQRNIFGIGTDEILKRTDYTGEYPVDYYYHKDGLGSVVTISDSAGDIIEKYFYDVYGDVIIKDSNDNIFSQSAINNRYMFTAREYDRETGLYYYRARMYSSALGRFLQPDPVGYYESMNLYQYVKNNPVNWIDPMGLYKCDPSLCERNKRSCLQSAKQELRRCLQKQTGEAGMSGYVGVPGAIITGAYVGARIGGPYGAIVGAATGSLYGVGGLFISNWNLNLCQENYEDAEKTCLKIYGICMSACK